MKKIISIKQERVHQLHGAPILKHYTNKKAFLRKKKKQIPFLQPEIKTGNGNSFLRKDIE